MKGKKRKEIKNEKIVLGCNSAVIKLHSSSVVHASLSASYLQIVFIKSMNRFWEIMSEVLMGEEALF